MQPIGSSDVSPQSSVPSQYLLRAMQRLLSHWNSDSLQADVAGAPATTETKASLPPAHAANSRAKAYVQSIAAMRLARLQIQLETFRQSGHCTSHNLKWKIGIMLV